MVTKKQIINLKDNSDNMTYSDLIGCVMALTEDTTLQDSILSYCNEENTLNNVLEDIKTAKKEQIALKKMVY